jgi:hypothetical protein
MHPEMDTSAVLNDDEHHKFQMLIGMLNWIVNIRRFDAIRHRTRNIITSAILFLPKKRTSFRYRTGNILASAIIFLPKKRKSFRLPEEEDFLLPSRIAFLWLIKGATHCKAQEEIVKTSRRLLDQSVDIL